MESIFKSIGADAWSLILSNLDRNEVNNFREASKLTKSISDEHFSMSRNQRMSMFYEDYLSAKYNKNMYYSVLISEKAIENASRLNCQREILKGIDELVIDEVNPFPIDRTHALVAIEKLKEREEKATSIVMYRPHTFNANQRKTIDPEMTKNIKKYEFQRDLGRNRRFTVGLGTIFTIKREMDGSYPNLEEMTIQAPTIEVSQLVTGPMAMPLLRKLSLMGTKDQQHERIGYNSAALNRQQQRAYFSPQSTVDFKELAKLEFLESLSLSYVTIKNFHLLKEMKSLKSLYIEWIILDDDDELSGISFLDSITEDLFDFRKRPSLVNSLKFAVVRNDDGSQEFRVTEINVKMIDITSVLRCKFLEKLETGCIEVQDVYPVDEAPVGGSMRLSASIEEIYPVDGESHPFCPSLETLIIGKSEDDLGVPRQFENIIPEHLVPKNIKRVEYYSRAMHRQAGLWLFETFGKIPLKSLKFNDRIVGAYGYGYSPDRLFPPQFTGIRRTSAVPPYIDFYQTSLLESTIEDLEIDVSHIAEMNVGRFTNLKRLKVTAYETSYFDRVTGACLRDIPRTITDLDISFGYFSETKEETFVQILRNLLGFKWLNKLSLSMKSSRPELFDLNFCIFFEIAKDVSSFSLSLKNWKLKDFSCLQYMKNLRRLTLTGTPSILSGKNYLSLSEVRYLDIDDFTSAINLSGSFDEQREFLQNITSIHSLKISNVDSHISNRYTNCSVGRAIHPGVNDTIIRNYIDSKPEGMNLAEVQFNVSTQ